MAAPQLHLLGRNSIRECFVLFTGKYCEESLSNESDKDTGEEILNGDEQEDLTYYVGQGTRHNGQYKWFVLLSCTLMYGLTAGLHFLNYNYLHVQRSWDVEM